MNDLSFKTEEEKQEYVESIFSMIEPLKMMISRLEEARINGEDLTDLVRKTEDLSAIIYTANYVSQSARDHYRSDNTILTYGQEKAIVDCLHNTATSIYMRNEYEYCEGAWYDLNPQIIRAGEALKRKFIKELHCLDLCQANAEVSNKHPKVKK